MLQGFNWVSWKSDNHYNQLQQNLPKFKQAGITKIWLPPSCISKDPEGYYPLDYYNFDSKYGNEKHLRSFVKEANAMKISTISDLVCWYDFCGFKRENYCFHGRERKIDSPELFDEYKEYSKYLIEDIGFAGIRLDYVKSHPAHDLGLYLATQPEFDNCNFIGELWDTMNYHHTHLEYNQNNHRQGIINYIDKTQGKFHMFDFTLKGILQQAINAHEFWRLIDHDGNVPGANGWYPSNIVTFIDNHDTLGQFLWTFSHCRDTVIAGYAYIMTHQGTPCIYYDHYFDYQNELEQLIKIRQSLDKVNVNIVEASTKRYKAIIDDRIVIQIGNIDHQSNVIFSSAKVQISCI